MAYCTQADIQNLELTEKQLIQLTDDGDLNQVDAAMVTAAIEKADAEIDAYCASRYTVPFSPVPAIVKGWSATLATFYLHRNRDKSATMIDRYNKVMNWLKAIADGERGIAGVTEAGSLPESTTRGAAQAFLPASYRTASVVLGTDGKTYTCIAAHTAATANRPASGADYANYWTEGGLNGATWATGANYIPGGSVPAQFGTMEVW